jgi:hypothetical protein
MNKSRIPNSTRRAILAGSIITACAWQTAAQGQFVWDGGGAPNALWSTATNWVGDTAPTDFSSLTFGGTANLVTNNDFIGFSATSITFGAGAGQFTWAAMI